MKTTTLGSILWVGCLQFFAAEAIAISGWTGSYSLRLNYISDLGATHCEIGAVCSPLHPLMNASFLLQGVLILGGAALVWSALARGWVSILGLALIGASALGVFLVGLAPEDVASSWHYLGAAENLICCNFGATLLGAGLLASSRKIGAAPLLAGLIGLAGMVGLGTHNYLGLGVGGMERVAAYPFPICLAGLGVWMLRVHRV